MLGDARDLDVLISTALRKARLQHPGVAGMSELLKACEQSRDEAHRRLSEALRSRRYRNLLLGVAEIVQVGPWRLDGSRRKLRESRFLDFAERELNRRLKKLTAKKKRPRIEGQRERERHRFRIKAKKIRYMFDFTNALSTSKSAAQARKELKVVQDALGAVHDAVVVEQLLDQIQAGQVRLSFPATIVIGTPPSLDGCIERAVAGYRKLRELGSIRL